MSCFGKLFWSNCFCFSAPEFTFATDILKQWGNGIFMQVELSSISQTQLKKWARLTDAKVRREEGIFLAEGIKVVEELLSSDWQTEAILVLPEKIKYWKGLVDKADSNIPVYSTTASQWKKLSQDKEPEGLMAIVQIKPAPDLTSFLYTSPGNALILYEINNPGNMGALMRSALWFGFTNIILSANCADYTNPKTVRASMGSLFHLTIVSDVDLIAALPQIKKTHYLVGSDVRKGLPPHPLPQKAALLLGSESHGLPEQLLDITDERWCIPGNAQADSLSLPQAAAVMMYEMSK
jgi:TrmH family RNA methyltransferase